MPKTQRMSILDQTLLKVRSTFLARLSARQHAHVERSVSLISRSG